MVGVGDGGGVVGGGGGVVGDGAGGGVVGGGGGVSGDGSSMVRGGCFVGGTSVVPHPTINLHCYGFCII